MASAKRATSILILNSKAGSMTPEIDAELRKAFDGTVVVEFDPKMDLEKLVGPTALIIVAGGHGTIGWGVRGLDDTQHPLSLLSIGNFHKPPKYLTTTPPPYTPVRSLKTA